MENRRQSWLEKGVDIWLIRDNLALSFEERVDQHQNTLDFIDDLREAGWRRYGKKRQKILPHEMG